MYYSRSESAQSRTYARDIENRRETVMKKNDLQALRKERQNG